MHSFAKLQCILLKFLKLSSTIALFNALKLLNELRKNDRFAQIQYFLSGVFVWRIRRRMWCALGFQSNHAAYTGTRTPGCIEEQALLLGWKQTKGSLTGTWEELLKKSTRKIANLPSRHTRRIWVWIQRLCPHALLVDHRITAWVRLAGTSGGCPVQPPCSSKATSCSGTWTEILNNTSVQQRLCQVMAMKRVASQVNNP